MDELQIDRDKANLPTPAQPPPARPTLARRIFSLPTLISLALAGAFLAFLATRLDLDFNATWRHLRAADPFYLALALAVHYTTFLCRGQRWRLLLNNAAAPEDRPAGAFRCAQLVLLGWFANSVAWLRLGDAYRAYLHHEESGASFVRTMGTILSERALDLATIVMLLAGSMPFLVDTGFGSAWTMAAIAGGMLILLALWLIATGVITGKDDGGARRILAWMPDSWAGRLLAWYRQFREGAIQSLRRTPIAALWGLLGWLAEVARLYLVTQALNLDLSLPLIVFLTLANSLLTLTPTPGGLGAVEAGLAALLKQLSNLSTPAALALVVVDRSISYLSVIAAGAALFLYRWARRRKMR